MKSSHSLRGNHRGATQAKLHSVLYLSETLQDINHQLYEAKAAPDKANLNEEKGSDTMSTQREINNQIYKERQRVINLA